MTQYILLAFLAALFYWITKSYQQYQVSDSNEPPILNPPTLEELSLSEIGLFVALMGKVAKSDGRVHELEAELIENIFDDMVQSTPHPQEIRAMLKTIFNIEKSELTNVEFVAQRLRSVVQNDPYRLTRMLHFLVILTYADGTVSPSEHSIIMTIGTLFGFSPNNIEQIFQQYSHISNDVSHSVNPKNAYALLGVSESSTNDEIKKAYRQKVKEFHPDIITAKGGSEDYIKEATKKVQEINTAYEQIKKIRGF